MTLYWWTHWFWITLLLCAFFTTVHLNPVKINPSKEKSAKYPLTAQSDTDDVHDGGVEEIPTAVWRDSKYNESLVNHEKVAEKPLANETISSQTEDLISKNFTNAILIENKEKITNAKFSIETATEIPSIPLVLVENTTRLYPKNSSTIIAKTTIITTTKAENIENLTETPTVQKDSQNSSLENKNSLEQQKDNNTGILANAPLSDNPKEIHIERKKAENIEIEDSGENSKIFGLVLSMDNMTQEEEIVRAEIQKTLDGERGRQSKVLAEYRQELKHQQKISATSNDSKNFLTRSASILTDFVDQEDGNISSEVLSVQRAYFLDAGTISGICFAVLCVFSAIGLASAAWYRRRYVNKPQTLSEPDSSGYIDDSTIKDNSDEMYSLDNDSFLNSLEAMTIQNYWTDTVKHTKL